MHIGEDHTKADLEQGGESWPCANLEAIESVPMDTWSVFTTPAWRRYPAPRRKSSSAACSDFKGTKLRLVVQSAEHELSPETVFQGLARFQSQSGLRLGYQGFRHVFVGVCQQDLGPQGLKAGAVMGGVQSGADEEGGLGHRGLPLGHSESHRAQGR